MGSEMGPSATGTTYIHTVKTEVGDVAIIDEVDRPRIIMRMISGVERNFFILVIVVINEG